MCFIPSHRFSHNHPALEVDRWVAVPILQMRVGSKIKSDVPQVVVESGLKQWSWHKIKKKKKKKAGECLNTNAKEKSEDFILVCLHVALQTLLQTNAFFNMSTILMPKSS